MENQITSLDVLTNAEMIRTVEERYEATKAEFDRLQAQLVAGDSEAQRMATIYSLKESYSSTLEAWDTMTQDEKRGVLQAFLDHIEATPIERQGVILVLHWRDGSTDTITLPRQASTGNNWLQSEIDELLALVDADAPQVEISAAFPDRAWKDIRQKLYDLRGKGSYHVDPKPVRDKETYDMYLERTQNATGPYQAGAGDKWREKDLSLLFAMLDTGATKMELAYAFQHRTWNSIRTQITKARGKKVRVDGPMPMNRFETFLSYEERIAAEHDGECSCPECDLLNSFKKSTPL
jgi:hypothetical protein